MPHRRIGNEADHQPLLFLHRIPAQGVGTGYECQHNHWRAIPPDAAGLVRYREKIQVIEQRLVVPRRGFIHKKRAYRVYHPLHMAQAIAVKIAGGDRRANHREQHRQPIGLPRANHCRTGPPGAVS